MLRTWRDTRRRLAGAELLIGKKYRKSCLICYNPFRIVAPEAAAQLLLIMVALGYGTGSVGSHYIVSLS